LEEALGAEGEIRAKEEVILHSYRKGQAWEWTWGGLRGKGKVPKGSTESAFRTVEKKERIKKEKTKAKRQNN